MQDALKRLKPAASKDKLKGSSIFGKRDCQDVCRYINEAYSVPEKGWMCEMKWKTLRTHAEAAHAGQVMERPGNGGLIPQTVIDMWVGWIGLDSEDQRNPPLNLALLMLWELCAAAGIPVPPKWMS